MNRVLLLHHNDPDGRMGGFIMKKYYEGQDYKVIPIECNYDTKVNYSKYISNGDKCCIVDYSLNHEEFKKLRRVVEEKDITWIDHHITAIQEYDEQMFLDGIRYTNLSGCELAYIYSRGYRQKGKDNVMNDAATPGEAELIHIEDVNVPRAVELIGIYDCWKEKDERFQSARYFIEGIKAKWLKARLTTDWGNAFWSALLADDEEISTLIDTYINWGKIIFNYNYSTNATNLVEYGFECKIRKFTGLKAIALNSTFKSSTVFEAVKNKYHIGVVFTYTIRPEKKMTCSIYRLGLDPDREINVGEIAKSFGGGGHKGAAGFSTSGTLPFVD